MNNPLRHLWILLITSIIATLIFSTCDSGGSTELNPTITEIQPESGPPGTAVTITGNDFSPNTSENTINFGENTAPVNSASETELVTEVPQGLETGTAVIEVIVDGNTATGPEFTVEAEAPGISSVEPDSGTVGTEITITGMNFSPSAAENTITFAGTNAPVNGAAADQLLTEVPQGAQDGPVEVTVNGKTATGPDFDVVTTGRLEITTTTSGEDQDDGYEIIVDGTGRSISANETITIADLEGADYQAELTDIADNCQVNGNNPRMVTIEAGETTSITFDINCQTVLNDQIVFSSDRDGDFEIFVMNADGSNPTSLTNNTSNELGATISNSGTKIAFASDRTGRSELFVMNSDGSDVEQVTSSGLANVSESIFGWSADDSKIAFTDSNFNIITINVDGSNRTELTNNTSSDFAPDWSSDGTKIAFQSDRDGDTEIFIMNSDGTGVQKITDNLDFDGTPKWSPDDSKITFVSDRDGSTNVYVMNSDGTGVQQITSDPGSSIVPGWSADGSEIVFETDRDGNYEIYKINSDGTGGTINLTANSSADRRPFWSPIE